MISDKLCSLVVFIALDASTAFIHQSAFLAPPVSLLKNPSFISSTSPLFVTANQQSKIDFLGSLENSYDLNPTNTASSNFLEELIGRGEPESLNRVMLESFEDVAPGKWRIIYVEKFSSSLGKLLGDIDQADIEIGNDGSLLSHVQYVNLFAEKNLHLMLKGQFGTASNHIFIKVRDTSTKQTISDGIKAIGAVEYLKGVSVSVAQSLIEKFGETLFSGVAIVDILFLDDDLVSIML
mmetsp:Transcript_7253/g.15120  ORF Transcript_7253/g.15120 Transcript_7253/m.15120 type:complete len:237 (+) Transcript_7253:110-820(+)